MFHNKELVKSKKHLSISVALFVLCMCVLTGRGFAAKAGRHNAPAPAARAGLGRGLMVTGPKQMVIFPQHAKTNPYVTGFQIPIAWSQLEPEKAKYDWTRIDTLLAECEKYDKQAAFKFRTADGKVMSDSQLAKGKGSAGPKVVYQNISTPAWLFKDPNVRRFGGIDTPKGISATSVRPTAVAVLGKVPLEDRLNHVA